MVATISAGTTAEYYTASADYYTGGHEPPGRWVKMGLAVGIEAGGEVEAAAFLALHAGVDRRGRRLLSNDGGKVERVGGYDVTLSAPKSVSVLWGVAGLELRSRIEAAQARAVEAATNLIERRAAFCRSGKNGVSREPTRITAAAFQHGDARPAEHLDGAIFSDPNLHTHLVIVNLGEKFDGRIGAIDGRPFFAWKKAIGATYHLALAQELRRIGLEVDVTGDNGIFEVRGVGAEVRSYFSARRRTIAQTLGQAGLTSGEAPALAAEVAKSTRRAKQATVDGDRHTSWRARVAEFGIAPRRLQQDCLAERDRKIEAEIALAETPLEQRLNEVVSALTEHESIFSRRDLHAAVAAALIETSEGVERIEPEIDRLIRDRSVITLDRDDWGEEIFTTEEMLRMEREIGDMVARLQERRIAGPARDRVEQLIAARGLSAEQAEAVRAATIGEAVTVIEGAPGSGKTTTLNPIKEAWQELGYRVVGSATAWRIANMLRADLEIEARATDSWLARAAHGRPFLDGKTIFILDEVGLLSSRQMHAVLTAAEAAARDGEAPRIVMVGDRGQLQSVGAGSGLRIVTTTLAVQAVETIQRQREPWLAGAIRDFGKGRASEALQAFSSRGYVQEMAGDRPTITALVDAWQKVRSEEPDRATLMIAKTNAEVRAISTEVRHRLRAQHLLQGDDVGLKAVTPSGHTTPLDLARGDRVRFMTRVRLGGVEVINGTEATVEKIAQQPDGAVRLGVRIGADRVEFAATEIADDHGRVRLAHAYATTIHGAQGLTTDKAFVLLSPRMDRHDIYVAASRGRLATAFFVDRVAVDADLDRRRPLAERGRTEISPDLHRAHLADRLSQAGVKLTTLDVIARAGERAEEQERLRSRQSLERTVVRRRSWDLSIGD